MQNQTDTNELFHYGVKGMRWGVRRFQNKDGSLTAAGKKRVSTEANADYTDKQRKRDRAFYGNRGEKRINKKLNEGHGIQGARHYEVERKEREEKMKRAAARGAKKTAKVLAKVGQLYVTDQVFFGGKGTKVVKETVKQTGRAAVTAFVMANGGYDIRWYDK